MASGLESDILTLPTAYKTFPYLLSQDTSENICKHPELVRLEPIHKRDRQEIIGHELFLNNSSELLGDDPSPLQCKMHDELLLRSILEFDITRIFEKKPIFIRIDSATLDHSLLLQFSGDNVVLAFCPDVKNADSQVKLCRELKSYGFRFSLDDFIYSPGLYPLLGLVDYLRFDIGSSNIPNVNQQLEIIPRLSEKTLIAKNVNASEFHTDIFLHPFRYYQSNSHDCSDSPSSRNRAKIIILMNMLNNCAETGDLEHALKQYGAIAFRILRYFNAPANGLRQEAHSIAEVMSKYGPGSLYRWLCLLLFSQETEQSYHDRTLLENALLRGRLVELFGQFKLPPEVKADLFVTGMLSFLSHLFKMPLEKALSYFALGSSITEALLNQNGPYSSFLKLALACENHDQAGIECQAKIAGISVEQANTAYIKAVVWVNEIEN